MVATMKPSARRLHFPHTYYVDVLIRTALNQGLTKAYGRRAACVQTRISKAASLAPTPIPFSILENLQATIGCLSVLQQCALMC